MFFDGNQADIEFIVDTGAMCTSLGEDDAMRLGVSFDESPKSKRSVAGVDGKADVRCIENVRMVIPCDGNNACVHEFDSMNIIKRPRAKKRANRSKMRMEQEVLPMPSLLGIDFLVEEGMRLDIDFKGLNGHMEF